jgi:hypothetical protein
VQPRSPVLCLRRAFGSWGGVRPSLGVAHQRRRSRTSPRRHRRAITGRRPAMPRPRTGGTRPAVFRIVGSPWGAFAPSESAPSPRRVRAAGQRHERPARAAAGTARPARDGLGRVLDGEREKSGGAPAPASP